LLEDEMKWDCREVEGAKKQEISPFQSFNCNSGDIFNPQKPKTKNPLSLIKKPFKRIPI
jgi:hypothetical protein